MVKTVKLGAKRSVYIPKSAGDLLCIAPGSKLELRVQGNEIILTPVVAPASRLPAAIRSKFLGRRSRTEAGLNLNEFSARIIANAAKVDRTESRGAVSVGLLAGEGVRTA